MGLARCCCPGLSRKHTALLRSQLGRQVSTQALRQPSCHAAHHSKPLPMGHVGNEHIRSLNSRSIQPSWRKAAVPAEGMAGLWGDGDCGGCMGRG